jgi:hypothetical protein
MGNHLIVMHSAVRACPGYDRHAAPAIEMDGTSVHRETEHGLAVTAQLTRGQATLGEAIDAASYALAAAFLPKGVRRQARGFAEDYFYNRLGLAPETQLDSRREIAGEGLEPMPEGMYRALEDVVELVVDGDYEALNAISDDRLSVRDLRRRVEDDCPAALVLPPREHYRIEAISRSDDSGDTGWSYFLDLWQDDGLAQLHIEGELAQSQSEERYTTTLHDVAP